MIRKKGHKLSEQAVLDIFREKHGNKYQYQIPEKFSVRTKIKIICPIHGEFQQTIDKHIGGQGCRKCGRIRSQENNLLGRSEWVKRFESVHGRGKYDYSKVSENIRQEDKIEIYCPDHNISFFQTPIQHWKRQQGCPKCGKIKQWENRRLNLITRLEFEKRARAVHGLLFEYSELPLEFSLNDDIILFCNEHNHVIFCKAQEHLDGKGCGTTAEHHYHRA